jgi:hypothetical protein
MTEPEPHRAADLTIAELLERLTGQTSRLVRQELALAREELLTKASRAGMGTMLFAGAGVVAVYGTGAVVAGLVAALVLALPLWSAALTIGGVLLAVAAVLILVGRRELRRMFPLIPEKVRGRWRADARAIAKGAGR